MYRIMYRDADGDLYVDTASCMYEGTWKQSGVPDAKVHKGLWIELETEENDSLFLETDIGPRILETALTQGYINIGVYGPVLWQSEIMDCKEGACGTEDCPKICGQSKEE